ncbi:MAG TPA: DUF1223 domain-containing protein [Xanthobacteraceae bacterium]|jgi:hypothetical protein|nr:DUF1223 domain-containing protein [Xanthobacteraceae bacterium]
MAGCRLAILAIATLVGVAPEANAEPRAVVELFTSQGCSSCPPADALLGKLAHDPNVIALTLAIDYWDYIGWKDTLAIPGHTNRQKAYSKMRGDRGVYTPQVIVNGSTQALGSDQADIERAIGQSHRASATLSVPVSIKVADGRLTVDAPAGKGTDEHAEVWLCPVSSAVPVAIGRGENHGRTITYHNAVRRWIRLGEWNGAAASWSISLKDLKSEGADKAAVLLQSGNTSRPGPMLGAAITALQ